MHLNVTVPVGARAHVLVLKPCMGGSAGQSAQVTESGAGAWSTNMYTSAEFEPANNQTNNLQAPGLRSSTRATWGTLLPSIFSLLCTDSSPRLSLYDHTLNISQGTG